MKFDKYYKQCHLVNGIRHTTSWVESKLAIEGRIVYINGESGWVIRDVGKFALTGRLVEILRDQDRRQRSQSDI